MDFSVQQHRLGRVFDRLNLMSVLVLGLLLSNLLTGTLAWYVTVHQKIEITPFSGTGAYQNSDLAMDNHYLLMMIENFMYSRLNITPETVRANHKRLLAFADVKAYPHLLESLNQEARLVNSKKISRYFEIKEIQVDEKNRQSTVTGVLKSAMKSGKFHEEPASYRLQYKYTLGRLAITDFDRLDKSSEVNSKRVRHAAKKQK
jgi:conjugal transfer pilus assembly protein TraE